MIVVDHLVADVGQVAVLQIENAQESMNRPVTTNLCQSGVGVVGGLTNPKTVEVAGVATTIHEETELVT